MTVEVGDMAPPFTLMDHEGKPRSLSDYSGSKVLIYFYPKAFTPGCTTQACDFRDRHESFAAAGFEILGISPDDVDRLERFHQEHKLPFPLLSDVDHSVATAYGAWGTKKNYGREYEGLIRSTFVVGEQGELEHVWRNVRAKGHGDRMVTELVAQA